MHANIIDGGTKEIRQDFVRSQAAGLVNLIHVETEKTSITIKQIQELVAGLSTHSPLPRIVWIEEVNLMTAPAQNALLKSLEEPPENTVFYLTCDHASSLLPTIRSRSLTTHLQTTTSTHDTHLPLIKEGMSATLGNRLQLVSSIPSDRTEALVWFDELLGEIELTLKNELTRLTSYAREYWPQCGAYPYPSQVQLQCRTHGAKLPPPLAPCQIKTYNVAMLIAQFELQPPTNPDYFISHIERPLYRMLNDGTYTQFAALYKYLIEIIPELGLQEHIYHGRVDGFTIRANGKFTMPDEYIEKMLAVINEKSEIKVIHQKSEAKL